jgi:hypothetical protein
VLGVSFSPTSTLAPLTLNENVEVKPLPVWDHKDSFKSMGSKTAVADMRVQPLPAPARKLDNLPPSTLPVWNHKDNFRFM